ncbi:MAG: hypothetical protein DSY42_04820 [Aquifex sp.]|nr:MAG: hypothetical protein DSY42_04820 [Aquifex sp.]
MGKVRRTNIILHGKAIEIWKKIPYGYRKKFLDEALDKYVNKFEEVKWQLMKLAGKMKKSTAISIDENLMNKLDKIPRGMKGLMVSYAIIKYYEEVFGEEEEEAEEDKITI